MTVIGLNQDIMKRMLIESARKALRRVGVDIKRARPDEPCLLATLLDEHGVDVVFDVGANIGQSGLYFRSLGFKGTIVSFEPVRQLFDQLAARALPDDRWICVNAALGERRGVSEINVSGGHAGASSILEMTDNVRINAPDQAVVRREVVSVETVDLMVEKYCAPGSTCFLKLDVQGYEKNVLRGAMSSLDRIAGVKLEMSLVENYCGETLLVDMIPFLYELGFRLVGIEPGWSNGVTHEIYQVDGVLFKESHA